MRHLSTLLVADTLLTTFCSLWVPCAHRPLSLPLSPLSLAPNATPSQLQVLAALTELVGFAGSELYIDPRPSSKLVGLSFLQLQKLYPLAVPMGIKRKNGEVLLRPPARATFEMGEPEQFLLL